ncbi:Plus3 domain-containing protein [Abeliophyllum distichum]|uniref:Plus3 domain-containing protein n=1 Tax=Abeliophyllum distichum TaxID=126358 RepID=A0ABD1Q5T4_9LAMI
MIGFLILWNQLGFPRPSVREFNSLYSFKSDGKRSGWWYASVKVKTGGSVITQTPDSIKNWKKFWFFVRGLWQLTVNDARPNVNIPVHYHELRYVSQEPTEESSERARRARDISGDLRSSSALITEENLISARLSPSLSDRPIAHQSREEVKDISALLRKKTHAGKGKRKIPAEDQEHSVLTEGGTRAPSSPQPTYLGSTPNKDEEFVRLRGALPKPVRDFIRSNSPTREEISRLPLSVRRAIRTVAKCWTLVQQKYLESMGMVDSVMAASVNVSREAIQLTSASEKMGKLLADVQVMREEGRKEELRRKDAELRALPDELETANKKKAEVEEELEAKKKIQAELRAALEKSTDKDEAVAEFKSSDAYLADQEKVYFLTMEELIEITVEKQSGLGCLVPQG